MKTNINFNKFIKKGNKGNKKLIFVSKVVYSLHIYTV